MVLKVHKKQSWLPLKPQTFKCPLNNNFQINSQVQFYVSSLPGSVLCSVISPAE